MMFKFISVQHKTGKRVSTEWYQRRKKRNGRWYLTQVEKTDSTPRTQGFGSLSTRPKRSDSTSELGFVHRQTSSPLSEPIRTLERSPLNPRDIIWALVHKHWNITPHIHTTLGFFCLSYQSKLVLEDSSGNKWRGSSPRVTCRRSSPQCPCCHFDTHQLESSATRNSMYHHRCDDQGHSNIPGHYYLCIPEVSVIAPGLVGGLYPSTAQYDRHGIRQHLRNSTTVTTAFPPIVLSAPPRGKL